MTDTGNELRPDRQERPEAPRCRCRFRVRSLLSRLRGRSPFAVSRFHERSPAIRFPDGAHSWKRRDVPSSWRDRSTWPESRVKCAGVDGPRAPKRPPRSAPESEGMESA
jgi:hypothetical protein